MTPTALISSNATVIAACLAFATSANAATFKGQMKFTSEAPKEKIFGTAKGSAEFTVDLADLASLRGTITVPVSSMRTGNEERDEHMRASNWLDAEKYPEIKFEIASVEVGSTTEKKGIKSTKGTVTGQFTLHGTTTTLTAPAEVKAKSDGKMKITTSFTIKLADYNVTNADGLIGSKVGSSIDCTATLVGKVQ